MNKILHLTAIIRCHDNEVMPAITEHDIANFDVTREEGRMLG